LWLSWPFLIAITIVVFIITLRNGNSGPLSYIEQLKAKLDSPKAEERIQAVKSLEQSSDPAARETLVQATQHSSPEVRIEAVFALARRNDEGAVSPLIAFLHDEKLRMEAQGFLIQLGERAIADLVKVLDSDNAKQKRVVSLFGRIRRIIQSLIYPDLHKAGTPALSVRAKHAVMNTLGQIGGDKAILPLIRIARNQDEAKDTRIAAIKALRHPKNTAAIEDLKEVLRDPDLEMRKTVIGTLGQIGGDEAMLLLKKIARNQDEAKDIRIAAIEALGQPKNTGSIYFLQGLFFATMRPSPDNLLEHLAVDVCRSASPDWRFADLCGTKYEDIKENRCIIVSAGKALRKIGCQDVLDFLKKVEEYIPDQDMVREIRGEMDSNQRRRRF